MKQRRKRQEPLMVRANPDATLWPRRHRWQWQQKDHLACDSAHGNPFLQEKVPQAHVRPGIHSPLGTASCQGDGSSERHTQTEADSSNLELEEVFVEDDPASPHPYKELCGTRRSVWPACLRPGSSAEDESDSHDVGDEYEFPILDPNLEVDVDQGPEDLSFCKDGGLDGARREELESAAVIDSLRADDQQVTSDDQQVSSEGEGESEGEEGEVEVEGKGKGKGEGEGEGEGEGQGCTDRPQVNGSPGSPSLAQSPEAGADLETYVLRPVKKGTVVQCCIHRSNDLFPSFYLYQELDNGLKQFLLAGRKRKRSITSNYLISLNPTDLSRSGANYVGKVRSNIIGTKFTIFDKGVNPQRKDSGPDTAQIREELGAVCYETNVFGFQGPRKMTVIIPGIDAQDQRISVKVQNESLLNRLQSGTSQGLVLLRNKEPEWKVESSTYVLNFHGRVTKASTKNFQIMHPNNPNSLVLQFGRVASDTFIMDFGFPLCALQAFAICLSTFDGKLACE